AFGSRPRDEHRPDLLQTHSRRKVMKCAAVTQNPLLSLEMALVADIIAGTGPQGSGIHNRIGRACRVARLVEVRVVATWSMTPLARNSQFEKRRAAIAIRHPPLIVQAPHMTVEAAIIGTAVKSRVVVRPVVGGEVPFTGFGVPGNW